MLHMYSSKTIGGEERLCRGASSSQLVSWGLALFSAFWLGCALGEHESSFPRTKPHMTAEITGFWGLLGYLHLLREAHTLYLIELNREGEEEGREEKINA